jgi:PAS domain S-box-containing protein
MIEHTHAPEAPGATPARDRGITITYSEEVGDGKTLSISPEIEAVLGYTQAEWMADPLIWQKLIHPEDRDRVVEACDEANRLGQTFEATYRMIARDGRMVTVHDRAVLVRGSQGQPLLWQGVMILEEPDNDE